MKQTRLKVTQGQKGRCVVIVLHLLTRPLDDAYRLLCGDLNSRTASEFSISQSGFSSALFMCNIPKSAV